MAAGYIKGITIEFGADVTKLNEGLEKVQGTINSTRSELRQIDRALKFNPGNTTLLSQKFELLQQSVDQTRTKLQGLRQLQDKMDKNKVDKTSAQYRELEREIIKTESQLKEAEEELKRFGSVGKQQVLAVGQAFKNAGGKIKSIGKSITTTVSVWGAAGIYAGSKLIELSNKQAEAEQKLAEIYKSRMGANKKAVQSTLELASAQQKLGVVGDEVQIAGAQQLATYAKYPATVNALLPAMNNLLVQQKGLNATQEDAAALANLFGKAMMGQTGALKRAGISFTEAQAEILKTGTEEERAATIAEVVTQNVGNMNATLASTDAGKIQQAKNAIGDMGEAIGAILLPAVADLVAWLQANLLPKIQALITWMQQHPQIASFALALAGITAVLGPLLVAIGAVVSAIGSIITLVATIGPAIAAAAAGAAPALIFIGAMVAAGVLLYKNWDKIKAAAAALWAKVKSVFTTMKNTLASIWNAIKTAVSNAWNAIAGGITSKVMAIVNGVKSKFTALKNGVINIWNGLKNKASTVFNAIKTAITRPIETAKNLVQKAISVIKNLFPLKMGKIFSGIQLPHFKISGGQVPWGIGGKGKKPSVSIDWHARAMNQPYMFSGATLFGAGERGDEMLYGRNSLMRDIAQVVGRTGNGMITVNVYGSDGMSVEELASAVEQRLITMQKRRTQAWA